jgi:6-phospho-beta-glucosidase
MLDVARTVREVAPSAYLINFTNPAGIVTEAMQSVLGDRVFGICDTPSELGRRLATTLRADADRVELDYVGLNHLGWMRRVLVDGVDVLPGLLEDDVALDSLEETALFGRDWLRTLGAIPNEYLYYFYNNREAVRRIRESDCTRGEYLLRTQREFYAAAGADDADAVSLWRSTVSERSASYMAEAHGAEQGARAHPARPEEDPAQQGYAGVAVRVMAAISRNEPATVILNVRNGGVVGGLPDDAVVEVPTSVDAAGVHPLTPSAPNLHQLGLMQQVKDVERHAIRAALTGDRGEAVQAFALHPLVDSVEVARRLLAGYIAAVPEIAAVFAGDGRGTGQRSNTVTSSA